MWKALKSHVRTGLVLRHLRADDEERLLERLLEQHRQEGTRLGERVGAMENHERVVLLIGRLNLPAHRHAVLVHDVGRVLAEPEVNERELGARGDLDPLEELGRRLGRTERISDHAQCSAGVQNVNSHERFPPVVAIPACG
ncbi:MAG: hypothetical protein UY92_C0001G0057 [Candidatus Magasanikbacteria bacterium GW2011_GWA2_56_11]|uniref:Uncharacterized protein n=1 Tax=Candidatus Magasanikbacteria bacterium GW2011_GWA2_56_11 TaxID=1619044 RepID=A0A0G1YHY5_9BACT|nr:MAG: hypothetical protein UY92_C0001G0057 [Candidatus Magasanikbacteria bacterium GW2011_GWA2_56_11]